MAPQAHIDHVARDPDETAHSRLLLVVREIALATEDVHDSMRTCLYSLDGQQGNAHLHWHIATLAPGVPYEQQQFHALMAEHGVLSPSARETADAASRPRRAVAGRGPLGP
ncbi:hypothetical protein [Streptomyces sp. NPDC093149]|uniref:hypothetical protein n=1 Tax=Streptomyces sp. NPDC093149 TaxID=3366031 RepID=UPI00382B6883